MKALFIFLFSAISLTGFAEHKTKLVDKPHILPFQVHIIDSVTLEPVPFTYLIILNDSEKQIGFTANFEGIVPVPIKYIDKYDVMISSMGYEPLLIHNFDFSNKKSEINVIYLSPKSVKLKEFTVTTYKNKLIDKSSCGTRCVWTECFGVDHMETKTGPILSDAEFDRKAFLVYPNPTLGELKLTNLPVEKHFLLIDMSGKVLQEIVASDAMEITIDLSQYPSGLYFIQNQEDNEVKSKKIIKN
jgi:hypothetical protein